MRSMIIAASVISVMSSMSFSEELTEGGYNAVVFNCLAEFGVSTLNQIEKLGPAFVAKVAAYDDETFVEKFLSVFEEGCFVKQPFWDYKGVKPPPMNDLYIELGTIMARELHDSYKKVAKMQSE